MTSPGEPGSHRKPVESKVRDHNLKKSNEHFMDPSATGGADHLLIVEMLGNSFRVQ